MVFSSCQYRRLLLPWADGTGTFEERGLRWKVSHSCGRHSLASLAAGKETGVAIAACHLSPVSDLKTHLNTMPKEDLELLPRLVSAITPTMVRGMQASRPFKSWPDMQKRVPSLTDKVVERMKDFFAVNMARSNRLHGKPPYRRQPATLNQFAQIVDGAPYYCGCGLTDQTAFWI